ncbi:hypothetical protein, partial [Mesobacillus subterraneus]|uniref:hypothetical protein n=1 Tax=Mesobacillus subterraneus TaxID=285983 RepID=UPI0019D6E55B
LAGSKRLEGQGAGAEAGQFSKKFIFSYSLRKTGQKPPGPFWFRLIIEFHSRNSLSAGRQVSLLLASLKPIPIATEPLTIQINNFTPNSHRIGFLVRT